MMNSDNGDDGFGVGIDLLMIGSIGEGVGINGDHLKASFMAYYRYRRENMEAPLYFSSSLGCPVNSAAPSRNSTVRGRTAEAFCRARGRFAVPDEPRSLRGRLAVLGKPREDRADTEEARGLLSLRGRLAVLGEPREDRAGTRKAEDGSASAVSSRSMVDRARTAQAQSGAGVWAVAMVCLLVLFGIIKLSVGQGRAWARV